MHLYLLYPERLLLAVLQKASGQSWAIKQQQACCIKCKDLLYVKSADYPHLIFLGGKSV